jgi:hypothetical protein
VISDVDLERTPWGVVLEYRQDDLTWAPIPDWANWLISLGHALASLRLDNKIWVCISVPERRVCSSLVAFGAIRYSAKTEGFSKVEERLLPLKTNAAITWLDSSENRKLRSGRFLGIRDGYLEYQRRGPLGYETPAKRPLNKCQTFFPMEADEEPFAGPREIASDPSFVSGALGLSAQLFCVKSSCDVLICGVKSQLLEDLNGDQFSVAGESGQLLDLVRPVSNLPQGQRGRSRLLSSSTSATDDEQLHFNHLAIFDGPQSYLRLREVVDAPVNLLILDRWEPRSKDAAVSAMLDKAYQSVDCQAPDLPVAPPFIEVFVWAEEFE